MSDPLIRELDNYVVLEPGKDEKFLSAKETLTWLINWLKTLDKLPEDLNDKNSISDAAQYLLDTACELEITPGFNLQWFAVRLNSPNG